MVKMQDLADSLSKLERNVASLTDTVTKLKHELTEMKTSVQFVSNGNDKINKTVSDISERFERLEGSLNTADQRYHNLQMQYRQLHERIISIESQSKRDNLLIDGIPEPQPGQKETSDDCLRLAREFFTKQLKLKNVENIRIVRCHRHGRPLSTGSGSGPRSRPSAIILQFHWFGDREMDGMGWDIWLFNLA